MNRLLIAFAYLTFLSACANATTKQAPVSLKPITVTTLAKTDKSWNGSVLPGYKSGQPKVTILRIVIQPGVTLDWHKHPIINAGFVVSGQIRVESEQGDTMEFKQGDTIVELVNQFHHGINHGKVPAELIVFYAGSVGLPLSIAKSTSQPQPE